MVTTASIAYQGPKHLENALHAEAKTNAHPIALLAQIELPCKLLCLPFPLMNEKKKKKKKKGTYGSGIHFHACTRAVQITQWMQ